METVTVKKDAISDKTVKASQFAKPYFEFSGACAGCGETPYIKLVTQLFGDHMYITNASGCSSAYGGSTPSTPYCIDCKGCGPAWAMSLFEDNAEYAYGYLLGQDAIKRQLKAAAQILADKGVAADVCKEYIEKAESSAESRMAADALLAAVSSDKSEETEFIRNNREFLTKKSVWAFGGDGWARRRPAASSAAWVWTPSTPYTPPPTRSTRSAALTITRTSRNSLFTCRITI